MKEFVITVSNEELKALEWDIYDVQAHFQNAINEKARRVINRLIEQHSDKNPKKISQDERKAIIQSLDLETAKERNARIEKEMLETEN